MTWMRKRIQQRPRVVLMKVLEVISFFLLALLFCAVTYAEQPWSSNHYYIRIPVSVTAYTATPSQCDSTPHITASNIRVRLGIVALSRDLERQFDLKFGDKLVLEGLGVFEFQDRMHSRWRNKVDIFMFDYQKALHFGVKKTYMVILCKMD